jgi:hypothetical protein
MPLPSRDQTFVIRQQSRIILIILGIMLLVSFCSRLDDSKRLLGQVHQHVVIR